MNAILGCGWAVIALVCVVAELSPKIPTDAVFTKLALAGAAVYGLYMANVYL
jgi:hypothetical protein